MIDLATWHDEDALLDLMTLVDGPSWTPSKLSWQYWESPACSGKIYVIRDGVRIVAMYGAVALDVSLDGKTYKARRVQDVMTHPDYRGRGYLHMLAKRCVEDLDANGEFGFTFPNKQSEGSFRRTGWLEFMPIILYKRPPDGIVKSPAYLEWRYKGLEYSKAGGVAIKRHGHQRHLCEMEITSWFPLPGLIGYETDRFMFTYPFRPSHWALTHGDSDVY